MQPYSKTPRVCSKLLIMPSMLSYPNKIITQIIETQALRRATTGCKALLHLLNTPAPFTLPHPTSSTATCIRLAQNMNKTENTSNGRAHFYKEEVMKSVGVETYQILRGWKPQPCVQRLTARRGWTHRLSGS